MQHLKSFHTETVINGLVKRVIVSIEVETETDLSFEHWDADLAKETEAGLKSGLYEAYWVKVTARFSDLSHYEGLDTLGQVIVKSKSARKELLTSVADHDMRQNAIDDLVAQVLQGHESLNQFLGKAA